MKNQYKRLFISAAALVLVGLSLLITREPGTTVQLADGRRLGVAGVSIGTNVFSTERPWHALARRVLPLHFQRWVPQPLRSSHGSEGAITVWLRLWNPDRPGKTEWRWARSETVAKSGEIFPTEDGGGQIAEGRYQPIRLQVFPRRARSFQLRLCGTNDDVVATFRIKNPCPGPFPNWVVDPLPVTKTNGDLTVTFEAMRKYTSQYLPGKTNTGYNPRFAIQWKGSPSTDWRPGPQSLEDATGNWVGGLVPGLSERERVWRLHQWFFRKREAPVPPEEHIFIPNLLVPSPGQYTNLNILTNLQGVGLGVLTWTGPAALTFSNGLIVEAAPPVKLARGSSQLWGRTGPKGHASAFNFGSPTLFAAHQSAGLDFRVDFVFRDEAGRVIPCKDENLLTGFIYLMVRYSPDASAALAFEKPYRPHEVVLQPVIPEGCRGLSLEVIVQRGRTFDFYFEPPTEAELVR